MFALALAACLLLLPNLEATQEASSLKQRFYSRADDQHPLDLYNGRKLKQAPATENPDFALVVNVTELEGDENQWVRVSWSGVTRPNDADILALYAVGAPDWNEKAPIKTLYASDIEGHLSEGLGTVEVLLLNHRTDVRFIFVRNFLGIPRIAGMSEIITIKNKNYPTSVHLALTGNNREIMVQWVSAMEKGARVKCGTKSGKYDTVAIAESITYTPEDVCGGPAAGQGYIFPGFMHAAVLTNLTPGVRYYYIVGNEIGGYSKEQSFLGPPLPGSSKPLKLLAVADMGQYNVDHFDNEHGYEPSLRTAANINREKDVDLVMHVGDISYAMGYVADWDVFFDQMNPLVSTAPYMTVPGNHERLWPFSGDRYDRGRDSGGECGVVYERRLQMPVKEKDKPFYGVNFGPIHFLTFSSEHPFEEGTEQYQFLEADLKSVNRSVTPWVIVCFHRPMYPGITRDGPPRGYWWVAQELQKSLADLFLENKVDLLFSGHHHSYHRTCPVHKEKCLGFDERGEAKGPVQLSFGNAGARQYTNLVKREFIEYQVNEFGYMRFTVDRKSFKAEAIRNRDRVVMDTVTLHKA